MFGLLLLYFQSELKPDALEPALPNMTLIAPDIAVKQVAPRLWVYSFLHKLDDGTLYPANGILVVNGSGGTLVDAGWDESQASKIYAWATGFTKINRAISTHFHADRTGGNAFFVAKGIPVYASAATIKLAPKEGKDSSRWHNLYLSEGITKNDFGLKLLYPGAGHAPDNIVIFDPDSQILYGGCFLKSTTSKTLGNMADADVPTWRSSLHRVTAFTKPKLYVPGHGVANKDALRWTQSLVDNYKPMK